MENVADGCVIVKRRKSIINALIDSSQEEVNYHLSYVYIETRTKSYLHSARRLRKWKKKKRLTTEIDREEKEKQINEDAAQFCSFPSRSW